VKRSAGTALLLLSAWLSCCAAPSQAAEVGAFVIDSDTGCKVWNPHPTAGETARWTGACVNGFAQGAGSLQWLRDGKAFENDDGEWDHGRQTGRGKQNWKTGSYEGNLLDGEPNGYGVMTLQSARYVGEFRNGKPNGEGTVTNFQGVFSGTWRDGCLTRGKQKITFAVSSDTCR
jgi:hypothetical protein